MSDTANCPWCETGERFVDDRPGHPRFVEWTCGSWCRTVSQGIDRFQTDACKLLCAEQRAEALDTVLCYVFAYMEFPCGANHALVAAGLSKYLHDTRIADVPDPVAALKRERDGLRTVMRAWHEAFGSQQLTHALATYESALSQAERLERQRDEARTRIEALEKEVEESVARRLEGVSMYAQLGIELIAARKMLRDVHSLLTEAARMGAGADEPEGTRWIQISATLADLIAADIGEALAGGGDEEEER